MIAYFDGSCEPINPGGTARYGWAIVDSEKVKYSGWGLIGEGVGMTNNIAEYHALIRLLHFIDHYTPDVQEIRGDSLMIINMATGVWGKKKPHKKAPHLLPLCIEARELVQKLRIPIRWIPREENGIADELSKKSEEYQELDSIQW